MAEALSTGAECCLCSSLFAWKFKRRFFLAALLDLYCRDRANEGLIRFNVPTKDAQNIDGFFDLPGHVMHRGKPAMSFLAVEKRDEGKLLRK